MLLRWSRPLSCSSDDYYSANSPMLECLENLNMLRLTRSLVDDGDDLLTFIGETFF